MWIQKKEVVNNAMTQQQNNTHVVKLLAGKVITMVSDELKKTEMQQMIKDSIINPITQMIYKDLYPYVIALSITIMMILVLCLLTFSLFIFYYVKK